MDLGDIVQNQFFRGISSTLIGIGIGATVAGASFLFRDEGKLLQHEGLQEHLIKGMEYSFWGGFIGGMLGDIPLNIEYFPTIPVDVLQFFGTGIVS